MNEAFSVKTAVLDILRDLAETGTEYVPKLITALVVLLVGFLLAKIGERIFRVVLERIKLDALLEKTGILDSLKKLGVSSPPSSMLPRFFFILFMFIFVQSAAAELGLHAVSEAITSLFAFLPNAISALLIILFGNSLGQFIGSAITATGRDSGVVYARTLGNLVAGLVLVVVVIIALAQLKVDIRILNILTIVIFSGIALGFALTFGLGTRDTTRNIIAGFYARKIFRAGQETEIKGERGVLHAITATQTLIQADGVRIAVPNAVFLEEAVKQNDS